MSSLPNTVNAKIEDLGWLQGSWSCPQFGGTFEEHWLPSSGGTMQGCGKLIVAGKTEFMEYMSIEPSEGGLTMWMLLGPPSKGEKEGVPFQLTSLTGRKAIFENPKNEFPSKMTYQLLPSGSVDCVIEGMQKGKDAIEKFPFKPMK